MEGFISSEGRQTVPASQRQSSGAATSTVLLLILLLTIKQVNGSLLEDTLKQWSEYKQECEKKLESDNTVKTGLYCNGTFDRYACWPRSSPGIISIPCPWYLPWVNAGSAGYVHRYCSDTGLWQRTDNSTTIWRDHSECSENNHFQQNDEDHAVVYTLRSIYRVGYSVSLVVLVFALLVLSVFRKLHCTRNYIHMNLFASFILRAIAILTKDALVWNAYAKRPNDEVGWLFFFDAEVSTSCRVSQLLMHYFVGANYFWLLVEGIYLHTLLITAVVSERHLLQKYLVIGWVLPVCFVLPWVIAKSKLENTGCWGFYGNMGIWWMIRGPMMLSIMVNFYIFIRIIWLLISKLKARKMSFSDYKCRLARSTLVLIPLLGIHEIVFTVITDDQVDRHSKHIRHFIQFSLSSFQGFVVAMLYCFCNEEVKAELRKQRTIFLSNYFPSTDCFAGKKQRYLKKCSKQRKKSYFGSKLFYSNIKRTSNVQLIHVTVNVIADFNPENNVPLKYYSRRSFSESSDGGLTNGETIEEVFEESEA
ncbi:glucagon-like peptide 2 receptor [Ambystoma mexicanum]|uniref:glucagon-like peptide 2 receptor n=1 Tax=Ambystoma mexicanum TaxID=8296 RepID=UPI0037E80701